MKTLTEIKQEIEKGCGKMFNELEDEIDIENADDFMCSEDNLCQECKTKLTQFKEDCKRELEFLENELIFMNDLFGCDACIISKGRVNERISQLIEVVK
jgi:hypothetical protein